MGSQARTHHDLSNITWCTLCTTLGLFPTIVDAKVSNCESINLPIFFAATCTESSGLCRLPTWRKTWWTEPPATMFHYCTNERGEHQFHVCILTFWWFDRNIKRSFDSLWHIFPLSMTWAFETLLPACQCTASASRVNHTKISCPVLSGPQAPMRTAWEKCFVDDRKVTKSMRSVR